MKNKTNKIIIFLISLFLVVTLVACGSPAGGGETPVNSGTGNGTGSGTGSGTPQSSTQTEIKMKFGSDISACLLELGAGDGNVKNFRTVCKSAGRGNSYKKAFFRLFRKRSFSMV